MPHNRKVQQFSIKALLLYMDIKHEREVNGKHVVTMYDIRRKVNA